MRNIAIILLLQTIFFVGCSKVDIVVPGHVPPPVVEQTNSEKISNADWANTEISKNVRWKYKQFSILFDSNQSITILEVADVPNAIEIKIPYVESGFSKTSDAATSNGALAAINGSYFDPENGGSTVFFKIDGVIINETRDGFNSYRENAGLGIDASGKAGIIAKPAAGWASSEVTTLLVSGPLLLSEGKKASQLSNKFNDNRHPRTAIGLTADGRVLAVVIDGRSSEANGVNIEELTTVMDALGCTSAMNMDGGGSSTAWVKNQGIVSYPSDNKKFDHEGERGVATVISFLSK